MKSREEIIEHVKQLAIDLGRTPFRREFVGSYYGAKHQLESIFGNYTILIQAAGLPSTKEESRKIDSRIFERDIELHIQNYKPRDLIKIEPCPTAAIISDIHWPFVNKKVEARFIEYVGDMKPVYVVINGDAWDMYSHGKFPRSHNVFTPKEEQSLARKMNEEFWFNIKKVHPKAQCVQMLGNHDIRPMKRALEAYPEAADWIAEKLKDLFTFEGVKTIHDHREEFFLNSNTIIFHGYRGKLGDHRDYTVYNCVVGHTHNPGVVYRKIRSEVIWELNSGFAGDPEAKGLTYTPQKITHWSSSFAAIDNLGPRVILV